MPELAPKQVATWLLIGALVLFFGARALNGSKAESIEIGPQSGPARSDVEHGPADPDAGGIEVQRSGESSGEVYVHVAGAVRRPGLYRLPPDSRVAGAIKRAGGPRPRADIDSVNLAATINDGQQIVVPRRGAVTDPPSPGVGAASGIQSGGTEGSISLTGATAEQLEQIDGIGPVTAGKILEFRDSRGGVESIEELDTIPGIGPATMEKLREALVP